MLHEKMSDVTRFDISSEIKVIWIQELFGLRVNRTV